jgi:glyoxylase-like metal-dependent hydrolase (beta-lactamase superfamily II)
MCFILEEEQAMFTGDNVLGHGTSAVEHLSTWMGTLQQMKSHNCPKGYPAHGMVIDDLRGRITGQLAQKVRRERQVLKALKQIKSQERAMAGGHGKGSVTVKQLVSTMHGDSVNESIKELALEPFTEEILRKLAEDGNVAFEIRAGIRKWFVVETA